VTIAGVCVLGLVPGVALSAAVTCFELARRRPPLWVTVANTTGIAMYGFAGGLVFALAEDRGWAVPGEASLPLWVFLAAIAGATGNALVTLPLPLARRLTLREVFLESYLPMIPLELCGGAIAAATVQAYTTLGFPALYGLAAFMFMLVALLEILSRGERRREMLLHTLMEREALSTQLVTVAERERRSLAAAIHDDALQQLVSLSQDLAEPHLDPERIRAGLLSAEQSLRATLSRLDAFVPPEGSAAAQLRQLAALIGPRAGVAIKVRVAAELEDEEDPTVVSCGRELLLNIEKHAHATSAWVDLRRDGQTIVLEVSDDGRGGPLALQEALDRGHIGLALVGAKAAERSGRFTHAARAGGGLTATVELKYAAEPAVPV
jgi:two-component system NarL family sensor kinase